MSWDPAWEQVYRTRGWGRYPGEDLIRFLMRQFGEVPDRGAVRLLEVGCGSGANLWFMAREGFRVHGVEASPTAVQLAAQRLDAECPGWRERGGRIDVGDMARVDAAAASFDAVIDVVATCYAGVDEATRIFAELARVCRPGGRLFSRTFATGCWGEGSGAPAGPCMWTCAEGPLAGLGATRFTSEDEVAQLLGPAWHVDRIERATQTDDDRRHELRYLQIHATRRTP